MTIKALYPTIRPSLDLNFARTRALDPRITFTRASTGTFVGSNGLIQTAASGVPRFDFHPTTGESLGLLMEEARTNSLWPSEPTTATLRNGTGSPGNTWAVYDGTVSSASRNTIGGLEVTINSTLDNNGFSGGNATNWGGIGGGGNHALGTVASVSLFINPLTWTGNIWIGKLPQDGNTTFVAQTFQLFNNGIYTGPASNVKAIFSDGTYWLHHIAWTDLSTNTAAGQFLVLFTTTPGDNIKKFWAGGFQWEAGAFSTSYIPTTSSTVTRAADSASIDGANFNSWYNQSSGSVVVNVLASQGTRPPVAAASVLGITPSAGVVPGNLIYQNTDSNGTWYTYDSGILELVQTVSLNPNGNKFAWGLTAGASSVAVKDGVTRGNYSWSSVTRTGFLIGTENNGSIRWKRLTYYPVRLPDAQLQALTQ